MKKQDIIILSDQELSEKLIQEKDNLVKLKLQHAVSPLSNPMQLKQARKTIARLLTEINKRKKINNSNNK